jgi:hypothetical protein
LSHFTAFTSCRTLCGDGTELDALSETASGGGDVEHFGSARAKRCEFTRLLSIWLLERW